jgi:hypothetical protein
MDCIRQVHAGKKRVRPEVAAQLAEHVTDESWRVGTAKDRSLTVAASMRRPASVKYEFA